MRGQTYAHPVFVRDEQIGGVGMLNLKTGEFELQQGSTEDCREVTCDLPAFLAKLHRAEETRIQLGIPPRTYHAYSFPRLGYEPAHVRRLVEWARAHGLELRIWTHWESALLLVVIADPDVSEETGWELYQYVQAEAPSYATYGFSSWCEFCQFGVPVPDDWKLEERSGLLAAFAPDGERVVAFGC